MVRVRGMRSGGPIDGPPQVHDRPPVRSAIGSVIGLRIVLRNDPARGIRAPPGAARTSPHPRRMDSQTDTCTGRYTISAMAGRRVRGSGEAAR
jgi:hypothetical protein